MNSLSIQNIFGHGYQQQDLERYQDLGFRFRDQESSFAGSQQLHFINFQHPPCLEFIRVKDHQVYRDFVPPGMEPYAPGVNLCLAEDADLSIETLRIRYAHWEPYLLHENYEGGEDERRPGWNYLNFKQPLLPGTFVWVTGFEPPFPATHPKVDQPNTIKGIQSLIFNIEAEQFDRLSALTGQPIKEGILSINNVKLFSRTAAPIDEPFPEKIFSLAFVVLQAASLDPFLSLDPAPRQVEFGSQRAVWITNPPRSWDLLVTS